MFFQRKIFCNFEQKMYLCDMKAIFFILFLFIGLKGYSQKFTSSCECNGLYSIENESFKICKAYLSPYQTLTVDGDFDNFIIIKNITSDDNTSIVQMIDGRPASFINQRKKIGEYITNGNGYITIYFYQKLNLN